MKKIIISIIAFILFLGFVVFQSKKWGKDEVKVETLKKENSTNTEIINETKATIKRKVVNRAIPANDKLVWLEQNRCPDCKGE